VVAFVFSLIATIVLTAIAPRYARRRPQGTPVTWGEAMVAALFVFFVMFIAWGVLPHQWLTYADNDLQWRKDKIVMGPGDTIDKFLPFTVTYEAVRDILAAGIYIVTLGVMIALWAQWQNRGKEKPKELPTSAYGRPLVKKA
jgi:Na+-driven multidrug efflux pump